MPGAHKAQQNGKSNGPHGTRDAAGDVVPLLHLLEPGNLKSLTSVRTRGGTVTGFIWNFWHFIRAGVTSSSICAVVADEELALYWRSMKSHCLIRNFKGAGKGSMCDSTILSFRGQVWYQKEKEQKVLDHRVFSLLWQFLCDCSNRKHWPVANTGYWGTSAVACWPLFIQGFTWYVTPFENNSSSGA